MKQYVLNMAAFILALVYVNISMSQELAALPERGGVVSLYVCKQTGQFTSKQGVGTKVTDRYEHGTVNVTSQGPIKYQVNPNDFTIGTSQTKTWTGKVFPDVGASPAPGNCTSAFLFGHYNIFYSRPQGVGEGGTIVSTYLCGDSGCAYHRGVQGVHEIVNKLGDEQQMFSICSIDVQISDIECDGPVVTLHANLFPSGGNLVWDTPVGQFAGNDVKVNNPNGINPFKVKATYVVEGLTVTATKAANRSKLIAFSLPCCISKTVDVKDIAMLQFDGPCRPSVVFTPAVVDPATLTFSQRVVATAGGVSIPAFINVVNPDFKVTADAQQIKKAIETATKKYKSGFFSTIEKVTARTGACETEGGLDPEINFTEEVSSLCCPPDSTGCIKTGRKFTGSASWSYSVECKWPVYGIPYVATLDAVLGASADLGIELNAETTCKEPKICAEVEFKAGMHGGIGATVLKGAASADLQLVFDALKVNGQLCFYPPPVEACSTIVVGKLKVQGTVKLLWGLIKKRVVEYTIYDGYTIGPTCF